MLRKSFLLMSLCLMLSLLLAACAGAQAKPFTIGVNAGAFHTACLEGFKAGMAESGYVEGKNITYISSDATKPGDAASQIENLLTQHVDMLFVAGNGAVMAAKSAVAETGVPVIFCAVYSPVEIGAVESIAHPGGNLTGVQVGGEVPKALEWLVRITPKAKKVYVPFGSDSKQTSLIYLGALQKVQSQLGVELVPGEVHSVEEAVAAIERLPKDIDAVFRVPSSTLDQDKGELSQAAIRRGLPMGAGHPLDEAVLLTLSSNLFDVGKQAARLAHQVRQGIKPADLPVETGEFSVTINWKTAKAIGLDIPDEILQQANTIIR